MASLPVAPEPVVAPFRWTVDRYTEDQLLRHPLAGEVKVKQLLP